MKKQEIVICRDTNERKYLYNYLINNGYVSKENKSKKYYIDNHFPFVIESDNTFWICDSITCLACASSKKVIKTLNDYINVIEKE